MHLHGVSFDLVAMLDWPEAQVRPDTRQDYGEARMVAFIPYQNRLYVCVFVDRASKRRIISLRKANLREVRFYETEQEIDPTNT